MGTKKGLPSLRILIVEDNFDIAENIADYLEVHGHGLDFAISSVSEEVVFANSRPGVCCCDWIDAEAGKTEILDEKTCLLFDIA